jgi:hypothetical protein
LPVVFGLLLYIPGAIWLVALSAVWYWRDLVDAWKHHPDWQQRALWLGLFTVSIALLAISLVRTPTLVKTWLGFPDHFASFATIVKNFGEVFQNVFIKGAQKPELWLGDLPVLGVFTVIMFVLGVYFYGRHWQAPRSRLLLSFIILSAVIIALAGPVSLSLVIPLIYLVAIAGIGYLIHSWLKVFPRNPLARGIGITIMALAVGLACVYNLRQYFIAWPHNASTRHEFRIKDSR